MQRPPADLSGHPKYKVFADEVRSSLALFSSPKDEEDAEVISHLVQLKASLVKNLPLYREVPHKEALAMRLAEFSTVGRGPSVHAVVVDIYEEIMQNTSGTTLIQDFPMYSIGLFRLFSGAKPGVKGRLQRLYEEFGVASLPGPHLKGLLAAVIPALGEEEDDNDGYAKAFAFVTEVETAAGTAETFRALFELMVAHARLRLPFMRYMDDRCAFLLEHEHDRFFSLLSSNSRLAHTALSACLSDANIDVFVHTLRFTHKFLVVVRQCFLLFSEEEWTALLSLVFLGLVFNVSALTERICVFVADFPNTDAVDRRACITEATRMLFIESPSSRGRMGWTKAFHALLQAGVLAQETRKDLLVDFLSRIAGDTKICSTKSVAVTATHILEELCNSQGEGQNDNDGTIWSCIISSAKPAAMISYAEALITIAETTGQSEWLQLDARALVDVVGKEIEGGGTDIALVGDFLRLLRRILTTLADRASTDGLLLGVTTIFKKLLYVALGGGDVSLEICKEMEELSSIFYFIVEILVKEVDQARDKDQEKLEWFEELNGIAAKATSAGRDTILRISCRGLHLAGLVGGVSSQLISSILQVLVTFSDSSALLSVYRSNKNLFMSKFLEEHLLADKGETHTRAGLSGFQSLWNAASEEERAEFVENGSVFVFIDLCRTLKEDHFLCYMQGRRQLLLSLVSHAEGRMDIAAGDIGQLCYFLEQVMTVLLIQRVENVPRDPRSVVSSYPFLASSLEEIDNVKDEDGDLFARILFLHGRIIGIIPVARTGTDAHIVKEEVQLLVSQLVKSLHGLSLVFLRATESLSLSLGLSKGGGVSHSSLNEMLRRFTDRAFLLAFSRLVCDFAEGFSIKTLGLALDLTRNIVVACDKCLLHASGGLVGIDFVEMCDTFLPALFDGLERAIRRTKDEKTRNLRSSWQNAADWMRLFAPIASAMLRRYMAVGRQLVHISGQLISSPSSVPLDLSGVAYASFLHLLSTITTGELSTMTHAHAAQQHQYSFGFGIISRKESAGINQDEEWRSLLVLVLPKVLKILVLSKEASSPSEAEVAAELRDIAFSIFDAAVEAEFSAKSMLVAVLLDIWRSSANEGPMLLFDQAKSGADYLDGLTSTQRVVLGAISRLDVEDGLLFKKLKSLDNEWDEPITFYLLGFVVHRAIVDRANLQELTQLRGHVLNHLKMLLGRNMTRVTLCAVVQALTVMNDMTGGAKKSKEVLELVLKTLEVLLKDIIAHNKHQRDFVINAKVCDGLRAFVPRIDASFGRALGERASLSMYNFALSGLKGLGGRGVFESALLNLLHAFVNTKLSWAVIGAVREHFKGLKSAPVRLTDDDFQIYLKLLSDAVMKSSTIVEDLTASFAQTDAHSSAASARAMTMAAKVDRITLLLLSGTLDQHISSVKSITRFLLWALHASRNQKLHARIFLCSRALAVSVSTNKLMNFWPPVIVEILTTLSGPISAEATPGAISLLELAVILNIPEFVENEWIFLRSFVPLQATHSLRLPKTQVGGREGGEGGTVENDGLLARQFGRGDFFSHVRERCQEEFADHQEKAQIRPSARPSGVTDTDRNRDSAASLHVLSHARYSRRREVDVEAAVKRLREDILGCK